MSERIPQEPVTPFQDPALIERAGGDRNLLNRLAGLAMARQQLAENPDDPGARRYVDDMQTALDDYEQGSYNRIK